MEKHVRKWSLYPKAWLLISVFKDWFCYRMGPSFVNIVGCPIDSSEVVTSYANFYPSRKTKPEISYKRCALILFAAEKKRINKSFRSWGNQKNCRHTFANAQAQSFCASVRSFWFSHFHSILKRYLAYGYSVSEDDTDPLVKLAEHVLFSFPMSDVQLIASIPFSSATDQFSLSTAPGAFLVDIIPSCQLILAHKPFNN